ncbi:MAG TPA: hypothetical protein VMT34_15185 [Aggregatilineales bacterium]|nr:hypothetical protein [Aggregatilineales bacterium]
MVIRQVRVYDEFVDFMTSLPSLNEIVEYTISPTAQARVNELLTANRNRRLTDAEVAELDDYERLEHMIRRAKMRAFEKLNQQTSA